MRSSGTLRVSRSMKTIQFTIERKAMKSTNSIWAIDRMCYRGTEMKEKSTNNFHSDEYSPFSANSILRNMNKNPASGINKQVFQRFIFKNYEFRYRWWYNCGSTVVAWSVQCHQHENNKWCLRILYREWKWPALNNAACQKYGKVTIREMEESSGGIPVSQRMIQNASQGMKRAPQNNDCLRKNKVSSSRKVGHKSTLGKQISSPFPTAPYNISERISYM